MLRAQPPSRSQETFGEKWRNWIVWHFKRSGLEAPEPHIEREPEAHAIWFGAYSRAATEAEDRPLGGAAEDVGDWAGGAAEDVGDWAGDAAGAMEDLGGSIADAFGDMF